MASGTVGEKKLADLHVRLKKVMKSNQFHTTNDFLYSVFEVFKEAQRYWTHSPYQMISMITDAMKQYEIYFVNGDFEEDYYDDEDEPDSDALSKIVLNFILSLTIKNKFYAMSEINAVANNSSDNIFENFPATLDKIYTHEDTKSLLDLVMKASNTGKLPNPEEYYLILSESLSDSSREALLREIAHDSKKLTLEFVQLLRKTGKMNDASVALDRYYAIEGRNADYLKLRLELARECNESSEAINLICRNSLSDSPSVEVLLIATQALPVYADEYEEPFRQNLPYIYCTYLEVSQRLEECANYLTKLRNGGYRVEPEESEFYMRHIHQFPQQAEKVILQKINSNLVQTGGPYYYNIARSLKLLLEINDEKAGEMYQILKTKYKRRINLITLVDEVMRQRPHIEEEDLFFNGLSTEN